ncbi:hypothetical protein [Alistipes putredinis]|uniref:hypothetical protein n=1 Tax=Alistipes putredinis TaxID=28117 RepID=UPI003AB130E7
MKNFDLAAAKAGAAVCTRSKKPVEIITTNGRAGKFPILAYVDSSVRVRSFSANGQYGYKYESADDLMMRDDDYLEKLARGEYGNHIEDKLEKVDPTIKENLTVDREYWRRVYAGYALAGSCARVSRLSAEGVKFAIALADALLEELEKK